MIRDRLLPKKSQEKAIDRLSAKNLKFLQFIVSGEKIAKAYTLSGYKGTDAQAYALKTRLKTMLSKVFEYSGFSRDRLRADILTLLNLPCVDKQGNPIKSISFDQKERLLRFLKDELPDRPKSSANITQFVIHRYADHQEGPKSVDVDPAKVIDVPAISEPIGPGKSDARE